MTKTVFITGLGGTGKSTLVRYFKQYPVDNWLFYDFDKGKYPIPVEDKKEWRRKQHLWFLDKSKELNLKGINVCVLGVCLFPWEVNKIIKVNNNILYGYLDVSPEIRKQRLSQRGDSHLWDNQPKYHEIGNKLDSLGATKIDTNNKSVDEIANVLSNWLTSLASTVS